MAMKTNIIIIVFLLLFSISVTAMFGDEETTFVEVAGDSETYFTQQAGDLELGNFWRYVSVSRVVEVISRGTQGQPIYTSTPYYDLILSGLYPRYMQGSAVKFNITIINKGDEVDRDAILEYWIADPNGTVHFKGREVFEEVPQTCPDGRYNSQKGNCIDFNGTEFEPFLIIKERVVVLPRNATEGEWKVVATYETEKQEFINVFTTIEVGAFPYLIVSVIAIFTITAMILSGQLYVKEKRKRKKRVGEIIKEAEEERE